MRILRAVAWPADHNLITATTIQYRVLPPEHINMIAYVTYLYSVLRVSVEKVVFTMH